MPRPQQEIGDSARPVAARLRPIPEGSGIFVRRRGLSPSDEIRTEIIQICPDVYRVCRGGADLAGGSSRHRNRHALRYGVLEAARRTRTCRRNPGSTRFIARRGGAAFRTTAVTAQRTTDTDLAAVKARLRAMWESGDYGRIAPYLQR